MNDRPLKILYVAAEAAPFARVGGLADVAGALPQAIRAYRGYLKRAHKAPDAKHVEQLVRDLKARSPRKTEPKAGKSIHQPTRQPSSASKPDDYFKPF